MKFFIIHFSVTLIKLLLIININIIIIIIIFLPVLTL
jgi:hypothetical protein